MRQALAAGMSRFPEDGAGPLETLCAPVCAVQASCALEQLDKFRVDRPAGGDFSAALPSPPPLFANPDAHLIEAPDQPVEGWLRQGF